MVSEGATCGGPADSQTLPAQRNSFVRVSSANRTKRCRIGWHINPNPSRASRRTALTIRLARDLRKPCKRVKLNGAANVERVRSWLERKKIRILNVAGPRKSENPGIHSMACDFLRQLFGKHQGRK